MAASRSWQDASGDHPVRLLDPPDPLAPLREFRATRGRLQEMATGSPRPRIGFACIWEELPERTWSDSAWNLRAALRLMLTRPISACRSRAAAHDPPSHPYPASRWPADHHLELFAAHRCL